MIRDSLMTLLGLLLMAMIMTCVYVGVIATVYYLTD